jgi:3-oxocholest-4-en-26-oyl-CoA dehydrogenase alpha subunit
MRFSFSQEQANFRSEVESFASKEWATDGPGRTDPEESEYFQRSQIFRRKLAARGWHTLAWPAEWGGLGASPVQQAIYNESMAYYGAPSMDMGVDRVGPIIMLVGTDGQKREHLPSIVDGSVNWCQGFSEPNAGSDLASLATRATEDGDDYVINGQKIWTSGAHRADWMLLLARTDPDAPKHRGISVFLFPMSTSGITIRPLRNLSGGHGFNEVFFDNARVAKANLLGEKNRGWYTAATTLDFERSGIGRIAPGRRILESLVEKSRSGELTVRPDQRARLAESWIEYEIGRTLSYRVAWLQEVGQIPNYEASISKAFGSEFQQRLANLAMAVVGTSSLQIGEQSPASVWSRFYLGTVSLTIAGGTSEVQRNIVATRGLGLPRG